MKKYYGIVFFSLASIFLVSCAGTKKIDFKSAYKFSTYKYQCSDEADQLKEGIRSSEPKYVASINPDNSVLSPKTDFSALQKDIYKKMGISPADAAEMEVPDLKVKFNALDKADKKKFRKEIKSELKQLKKDVNESGDALGVQQLNQLSDLTRWSIIIGSVGLLLLILGAIFTGFLTFIGAILVVGAAVLFIIDQA